MQSQPLSHGPKSVSHDDDVYCADPRCAYCKDLRVAEERWKRAQKEKRVLSPCDRKTVFDTKLWPRTYWT